ncbi:MAG: discoidin domain-containing protein [Fibrobacterales bacterium]
MITFRKLTIWCVLLFAVIASAQNLTLVSVNKPATAKSSESSSLSASKALDNSMTTRWASAFFDNQWYEIDLEKEYPIEKIVLMWEGAYGKDYRVLGSKDSQNWTELSSRYGGNGGIDQHIDSYGSYRYIKLDLIKRATQWGFSLYEIEVYAGDDLQNPERGIEISWLGVMDTHPEEPAEGEAFHHSATEESYVFNDGTWELFAVGATGPAGRDGTNGLNGEKGEQGVAGHDGLDGLNGRNGIDGVNGQDGTDGINGVNGQDGADGAPGVGVQWIGAFDELPTNPQLNQAFYWSGVGISCLYDGNSWEMFSRDGDVRFSQCEPLVKLVFDANGGNGVMAPQWGVIAETVHIKSNQFTHEDRVFEGWASEPAGNVEYIDESIIEIPNENKTLYAQWDELHNIEYAPIQGGVVTGPASVVHGGVVALNAQPEDGYVFVGYELVSGIAEIQGNELINVRSDIVVRGVFQLQTHSVSYMQSIGGTITGSSFVVHGGIVSLVAAPEAGYEFARYEIVSGTADLNGNELINVRSRVVIRGVFERITYRIWYPSVMGGSIDGQVTVQHGEDVVISNHPQTGYEFTGFQVEGTIGTKTNDVIYNAQSDLVVRGDFSLREHRISITKLGSGNTSHIGDVYVPHGSSLTVLFNPSPGYVARVVRVDGELVTAIESYAFTDVFDDHRLDVEFVRNAAPTISSMIENQFVPTSEPVQLTAAAIDVDGDEVFYSWDVNNDGSEDRTGAATSFSYSSPISSNIVLKVCDRFGACNQASVDVRAYQWVKAANSLPIAYTTNHGVSGGVHDGMLIMTIGGYTNQGIYTSTDGSSWSPMFGNYNVSGGYDTRIVNSGSTTVLMSGGSRSYVINGYTVSEETHDFHTGYNDFGAISYGNSACHLMGSTRGYSNNNITCRYPDGTWTQHAGTNLPAESDVQAYYYNGSVWVITRSGEVYTTPQMSSFSNWTNVHNNGWTEYIDMAGAVFDNKMWLTGGDEWGSENPKTDKVKFSTDGRNWSELSVGLPTGALSDHRIVSYDEKLWIFGGRKDGIGNYNQEIWYMDIGQ